jgi:hypothetical protein
MSDTEKYYKKAINNKDIEKYYEISTKHIEGLLCNVMQINTSELTRKNVEKLKSGMEELFSKNDAYELEGVINALEVSRLIKMDSHGLKFLEDFAYTNEENHYPKPYMLRLNDNNAENLVNISGISQMYNIID